VGLLGAIALAAACGAAPKPCPVAPDPIERDPVAAADRRFEQGKRLYLLLEYDAAVVEFKEAFKRDPLPLYLFNIGQAYRKKEDCRLATAFFKNYLAEAPDAENRAKVAGWLEEMAACAVAPAAR